MAIHVEFTLQVESFRKVTLLPVKSNILGLDKIRLGDLHTTFTESKHPGLRADSLGVSTRYLG